MNWKTSLKSQWYYILVEDGGQTIEEWAEVKKKETKIISQIGYMYFKNVYYICLPRYGCGIYVGKIIFCFSINNTS